VSNGQTGTGYKTFLYAPSGRRRSRFRPVGRPGRVVFRECDVYNMCVCVCVCVHRARYLFIYIHLETYVYGLSLSLMSSVFFLSCFCWFYPRCSRLRIPSSPLAKTNGPQWFNFSPSLPSPSWRPHLWFRSLWTSNLVSCKKFNTCDYHIDVWQVQYGFKPIIKRMSFFDSQIIFVEFEPLNTALCVGLNHSRSCPRPRHIKSRFSSIVLPS